MDMMHIPPYIVYVKTDSTGRITAINSSEFLPDTTGWVEIDSGYGDKYHHAQGNYLPGPIMDERGVYCYKLVDGQPVARTAEEMDGDYTPPVETPSLESRVTALETIVDGDLLDQAAALALLGVETEVE